MDEITTTRSKPDTAGAAAPDPSAVRGTGAPVSISRWAATNAAGLAAAFGMMALLGGSVEAAGAGHESVLRDLSLVVGVALGGVAWVSLRRRQLQTPRWGWVAVATIVAFVIGFVGGFVLGAPPLDLMLAVVLAGTVVGAAERRAMGRRQLRPRRLALRLVPGWLGASVAAIVPLALVGDWVDDALGDVAGFAVLFALYGGLAGAIGGAFEARGTRRAHADDDVR